jgi:hypothetical protein
MYESLTGGTSEKWREPADGSLRTRLERRTEGGFEGTQVIDEIRGSALKLYEVRLSARGI